MIDHCVGRIVQIVVERFHPLRVILFGSHARGTARSDSDVDLLVVMSGVTDRRRAAVEIRRSLVGVPVPKDIVVATPEDLVRRGDCVGSILRPALREGTIVYERS